MFACIYCAPNKIDFHDNVIVLLKCEHCKAKRWCVYIKEGGGD